MLEIAYHHQWKLFELVVEGWGFTPS
jgi:hypothetical protein